jgi:hypothetical protein
MELSCFSVWFLLENKLFLLIHFSYRLRGTTTGANNRMDLLSLVTSGVNDNEVRGPDEDILGVVEGWQDDETHNPDVPAVSHKRGLTPFVFIPFEEVHMFPLFALLSATKSLLKISCKLCSVF